METAVKGRAAGAATAVVRSQGRVSQNPQRDCKATRFYSRHLVRLNFRETTPNRARFHELPVTFPLAASLPSLTRSRSATEEQRRRVLKLITSLTFNGGQRRQQNFCLGEKHTRDNGRPWRSRQQQQLSGQRGENDALMASDSVSRAANGFPARVRLLRPETGLIVDIFTVFKLEQHQKSRKPESNQAENETFIWTREQAEPQITPFCATLQF